MCLSTVTAKCIWGPLRSHHEYFFFLTNGLNLDLWD